MNPAEKYATRMTTNSVGLGGSLRWRVGADGRTDHSLPDRKWAIQWRLKLVNVGRFDPGIQAVHDAVLWRRKSALRKGKITATSRRDLAGHSSAGRFRPALVPRG